MDSDLCPCGEVQTISSWTLVCCLRDSDVSWVLPLVTSFSFTTDVIACADVLSM